MQNQKSPAPKTLSNEALLTKTKALVVEERELTTSILWHMHEIQKRRLYSEKGYGSLFEYAVKELSYSEAAAGRRIAAMRLLVEVPEIEPALQKGDVSLSTLSTIQSFIQRKEEPVSKQEKKDLVFALQGKSKRECEKHLVALDPSAATPRERERVVSPTQTEIRFVADDALLEKLKQIRELDGHVQCNASYLERFHRIADLALKKLDPLKSKPRASARSGLKSTSTPTPSRDTPTTPLAEPSMDRSEPLKNENPERENSRSDASKNENPRAISAELRRAVWARDQSCCSYVSSEGRRCTSRFALEIDHLRPVALGGKAGLSNLRLLCRAHNQQQALFKLGPDVMAPYLKT